VGSFRLIVAASRCGLLEPDDVNGIVKLYRDRLRLSLEPPAATARPLR
jgi:hypothetical protein